MPDNSVPTLLESLSETLESALELTADKWIRVEVPPDWPMREVVQQIKPKFPGLRLGILRPFTLSELMPDCPASDVASEITGWRNQSVEARHSSPTIILGDARKSEEAGLRAVPQIVSHEEVLGKWQGQLLTWLQSHINSNTPAQLFVELFRLASIGAVDAIRLDEYVSSALKEPSTALPALRKELWRINFLPDERVLDADLARRRLDQNLETRQLLLAASDTPTDINRLTRLREIASTRPDPADVEQITRKEVAQAALDYRQSQDRTFLAKIELDKLFAVLAKRKLPSAAKVQKVKKLSRRIDLFDLLDQGGETEAEVVVEALGKLGAAWELDRPDQTELLVGFNQSAELPMDVRLTVSPTTGSADVWAGDGSPAKQMLALVSKGDVQHDWVPRLPEGESFYGVRLIESAVVQDQILGGSKYQGLVNDYITARAGLVPYEGWLRDSAFPLLLLKLNAREAVRTFLATWHALVDAVNHEEGGGADAIRAGLPLLEALWGQGAEDNLEWCVLGPFHPYILDPLLRLTDYALASIGQKQLGKKLGWALGRSLPSYRILWTTNAVLFLAKQSKVFEFQVTPVSSHPPAEQGTAITQIARSFLGFHPFAREALVITLIDPPTGSAIVKNLRRLQEEVQNLRVYLVTTDPETSQLSGAEEIVRNLGRFATVEEWLARNPVKSHLVFHFTERSGDSASPGGSLGSTPGAHVALKILLENRNVFAKTPHYSPYVTFMPRDNNSPVVDILRLSNASLGTPRLFKTEPIMSDEVTRQLELLSDTADWAVIGVPAPLGLIAPRDIGGGRLTYLGREALGPYGLYVYATSLFPIAKVVTRGLVPSPVSPDHNQVEISLTDLAIQSANSVLKIGLRPDDALWEQLGIIVSSDVARRPNQ